METEDEQVEKLKQWWRENGRSIIAGVIIGVGGLFGYRYWVDYQTQMAEQASAHFDSMVEALDASQMDKAKDAADTILADFTDSEYAIYARLALAKVHVENSEFEQAVENLQQVVGSAGQQALGYLARKRLAAVQLQLQQPDAALTVLSVEFPAEFSAAVEELRGDIYATQGNAEQAADAYRKAMLATPGPANSDFLQRKLDDLGVTG